MDFNDKELLGKYGISYSPSESVCFNSCNIDTMVLSNFWPCKIKYNDILFHSVEQLFVWRLLDMFGVEDLKEKVMSYRGLNNGYKIKRDKAIQDRLEAFEEDYKRNKGNEELLFMEWKLLRDCVELKFKYCKEYREKLKECKGKRIVESCPWGDSLFGAVWNKEKHVYEGVNASGRCASYVMKKYIMCL